MILKDIRLLILLAAVAFSLYLILWPVISSRSGITVANIHADAKCTNVKVNSIITQLSAHQIKTITDFNSVLVDVKNGDFVSFIADGAPANCIATEDGGIGIDVTDVRKSNIVFGIDIEGGSRVLLRPKGNVTKGLVEDIISVLTTRINLYGLRDLRIFPIGENLIQVEMGGATSSDIVSFLSRQGKFEGKLQQVVTIQDNEGSLTFADKPTSIKLIDGKVKFDDELYDLNSVFTKDGIVVEVRNETNGTMWVFSTIFGGKDITAVFTDPENSFIKSTGNGYEFAFVIQVSQESANRFAKLTQNQPTRFLGSERYIEPSLVLFLDGEEVTNLNIVASLAGQALTKPSIQGFRENREAALNERLKMQSVLKSGSLPAELEIIKTDVVTQTAGKALLTSTFYVIMVAAVIVSIVIVYRYHDFKIAIPMILISFSEIILILGFAAFTQSSTKGSGWVLDIPAIAGIIAIIGTGVNQLIIITDQILQEKETSLKFRHKTAMSIIFNSAYIVIAAMLPLMIAGVGLLKGFAITTIIGVLIAIFITRPAYMAILEKIKHLA